MLGTQRKYGKIEDMLQQSLICIFAKQFNPSKFFPLLTEITQDPDLKLPANLIFSTYNLLIREQPQTAYNSLSQIQRDNPNSLANIAGYVVRSSYEAYCKKYKESLRLLTRAVEMCQMGNLDREFGGFYGEVVARMVEIYQFGAFKREYFGIMDRILNRYHSDIQNNQILKLLAQQKLSLKTKICSVHKSPQLSQLSSLRPNPTKISKFTFRKKQPFHGSSSKSRQKSSDSSKLSNSMSPRPKLRSSNLGNIKPKKYVNPYGLTYQQSQINKCVFM